MKEIDGSIASEMFTVLSIGKCIHVLVHVHVYMYMYTCSVFIVYVKTPFFGKITKAIIVYGSFEKWSFEVGDGIESFSVRMNVYMS